jgi:hypothetical protein
MTKLAKETGMTRAGLYKALSKDPSFDAVLGQSWFDTFLAHSCSRSNCHDFGRR